jgi:hypothetical protein
MTFIGRLPENCRIFVISKTQPEAIRKIIEFTDCFTAFITTDMPCIQKKDKIVFRDAK